MIGRRRTVAQAIVVVALLVLGCAREHLRGKAERSADGGTYLAIADDNGGACGAMFVDDREWPTPIDHPRPIDPGRHTIRCGDSGEIEFKVPKGMTFRFDYWGP